MGTGVSSPITFADLAPGVCYSFTVLARNTVGSSAPSEAVRATVPGDCSALSFSPSKSKSKSKSLSMSLGRPTLASPGSSLVPVLSSPQISSPPLLLQDRPGRSPTAATSATARWAWARTCYLWSSQTCRTGTLRPTPFSFFLFFDWDFEADSEPG